MSLRISAGGRRHRLALGAGAALVALAATACGGGSGSQAGSAAAASTCDVEAARSAVQPFLAASEPLTISEPLSARPPAGKKVFWAQGSLDDTSIITPGMEAATQLLGWQLETRVYDPSKPEEVKAVMEQGVASTPDFIAIAGNPVEQWQTALDQAKAKGIVVIDSYDYLVDSDPQGTGIYASTARFDYDRYADLLSKFVVADSNGEAKTIALVNVPAYPVLAPYGDNMRKALATVCPDVTVDEITISQQDLLAGNIPASVVAYLRTHPDVKYTVFSLGALTNGVTQALQSAGVTDVKLLGSNPVEANLQALQGGSEYAWIALPKALSGWYIVDAMARASVGDSAKPSEALLPTQIIKADTVPQPLTRIGFDGPPGYPGEFSKLWQLTSG